MNAIKAKFGRVKGSLTRALIYAEGINPNVSLSGIEHRLKKLDEIWSEFSVVLDELYEFVDDPNYTDPDPQFIEYEEKYYRAHTLLSDAILKSALPPVRDQVPKDKDVRPEEPEVEKSAPNTRQHFVQLPTMSIPTFSGEYKDWPAFRDIFTGSIDSNPLLTCTQKFHYLTSYLRGDAQTVLNNISCTEENYIEAWDKLERRYDKKNLIIQSFIQLFLSLPSCTTLNLPLLRKISDRADEAIRGLNALGANNRDPWLIYLLIQKLDYETRQAWAEEVGSNDESTIAVFLEFLQTRCSCLESCYSFSRSNPPRSKATNPVRAHVAETRQGCPKCKKDHVLTQCKDFIALSVEARRDFVKNIALCFNCLRPGHSANRCRSQFHCRSCKSRHHTLVHLDQNQQTAMSLQSIEVDPDFKPSTSSSPQILEAPVVTHHSFESSRRYLTILPTAVVRVQDKHGDLQDIRLLLDSGSQVSFTTERAVQRLGLPRQRCRVPIIGIASSSAGVTNGKVNLNLLSRYNSETININCLVLSTLTSTLPPFGIDHIPTAFVSLELADPTYNVPGPIDVLIGADKFLSVIKGAAVSDPKTGYTAIPTIFGWIVTGSDFQGSIDRSEARTFCTRVDLSQEFDLERFWKMEECSVDVPLSLDEQLAEELFVKGHTRRLDGRYEVSLPFRPSIDREFGNSFGTALNRFYALERRLESNAELKSQYSAFINEYLSLGHMEEISPEDVRKSENVYYLPHHAVFKADSSTTKIRVVFDASAKSNSSMSLNETLLVGPSIQRDIFSICLNYRRHVYVMAGDIEKMYRQIWVTPGHTDYQRIIWRQCPEDTLKHYRLLTVTYGTSAAPFLAIRTLKQLAIDAADTHPLAASTLQNDFYVDDVVTGRDTVEELVSLQQNLVDLLKSAGFNLRKWTTNCWPLLISLPEDQRELSPVDFEESNSVKLLGLQWCPSKDCFSYRVKLSDSTECTKRRILSDASRIYDPLGFLAPAIVGIKILFQDLWRKGVKWDEELQNELVHKWVGIRDELPDLEFLSIPRMIISNKRNWEMHGFCDASLDAYAAVVYCRSVNSDNSISVRIVAAKTKVAPIKVLSLPKLELCGAVLLTHLISKIKLSLQEPNLRVFAWTDSSIVLHWLSAPPKTWSVFVANRTSEILTGIPYPCWNHVRSASNPADVATRGISPSILASTNLWWKGPTWLSEDRGSWPISYYNLDSIDSNQLEKRKVYVRPQQVFTANVQPSNMLQTILCTSSNWITSVRVLAYILRYTSNSRPRLYARKSGCLTSEEMCIAKTCLIKCAQSWSFAEEIKLIKKGKELPQKNRLLSLSPFVDSDGVLRVGGRLEQSHLSYSAKHPIILCKSHPISNLIATYIHLTHLHPGVSLMFALVRQTYYILGGRNLLRAIVHKCVRCFEERLSTTKQLMADLPAGRVRYSRPFSKTGCDYAGPITLRLSRGRNPKFVKAYIALFVCFVTKAIHLELVGDLSSVSFLLALDRFAARRGKPNEIWSDNGTNFHGARRLLNEMYKLLSSQQHNAIVIDHLSKDNISWNFIPPSAPHFGGLWEAGVKSVKSHLRRVIGDTKLTYEEMYTLLAKIEALLNSRPMWKTSDDEPTALTPAHFLIGEPYTAIPQPSVPNAIVSIHTNWSLLQAMYQGFWSRWHSEYLTSLQQRPKWQNAKPNLQVDDVVLLREPNLPASKWILGRITKTHLGRDNRCRVVTVRTKFGEYLRPAVKVAPLPIAEKP